METSTIVFISLGILGMIGIGVFLYFAIKSSKKQETPSPSLDNNTTKLITGGDTTQPGTTQPGTTQGTTPPYIAVDPLFPPSSHYEVVVDDLNKLNPTKPTENGEVTINNVSLLLKNQNVLPHTDNMTIQTLFNMGKILFDETANIYKLAPLEYRPPEYGKPTLEHIIDVLNTLPINEKDGILYYTAVPLSEVNTIVPGVTNKTLQSLLNKRFQSKNNMFVIM